ncbi:MAG: OmpA family protein [Deltaproteobacteria bacterium]|nr:OmpA family protein [Deltaproteobacteria bacterium]
MPPPSTLYFPFDATALSPEATELLQSFAGFLREHARATLTITGHADERGTGEYNLALGEARARAARDYLVRLGVRPEQIRVVSMGEERPAAAGSLEGAWAKNRRDELVIAVEGS